MGGCEQWFGKISAQPHTTVKQICFPNGNVMFLSLSSLSKNWMQNVVWGCVEILPMVLMQVWQLILPGRSNSRPNWHIVELDKKQKRHLGSGSFWNGNSPLKQALNMQNGAYDLARVEVQNVVMRPNWNFSLRFFLFHGLCKLFPPTVLF